MWEEAPLQEFLRELFLLSSLHEELRKIRELLDEEGLFFPGANSMFSDWDDSALGFEDVLAAAKSADPDPTEGQALDLDLFTYYYLCNNRAIVRLVSDSLKSQRHKNDRDGRRRRLESQKRLENVYQELFDDVDPRVRFETFKVIDPTTLVMVQLGAGLIVLKQILTKRSR